MQDEKSANDREKPAEPQEGQAHLVGWGRGLTSTQSKMPFYVSRLLPNFANVSAKPRNIP